MNRYLTPETDINEEDVDFSDDVEEESLYNEEMSRAAIGKLMGTPKQNSFVSGYADDEEEAPKPAANPRVRRFDISEEEEGEDEPPKPAPRPVRRAPAAAATAPPPPAPAERQRRPAPLPPPVAEERPRQRRETTTTKLLTDPPDDFTTTKTEFRSREKRREQAHGAHHTPPPRSERPLAEVRTVDFTPDAEDNPDDGGYDTFRRRNNPGEMISPPRNPARASRQGDVRKNRIKPSDAEPAQNPLLMGVMGVAAAVLIIIIALSVRVNSLAGQRDEAREALALVEPYQRLYEALVISNDGLQTRYNNLDARYNELRNPTIPDVDPIPGTTGATGGVPGGLNAAQPLPLLPTTHVIAPGQFMNDIAIMYFGSSSREVLDHISRDNGITNFNNIQAGATLIINPMPTPEPPQQPSLPE